MSQIAGIQDFRQSGPPADTGVFQLPCSALVFNFVFSGTTYYCAVRSGERAWILIDCGIVPETVVNNAFTTLGAGAHVVLADHTFTLVAAGFSFSANEQVLEGQGRGTFIDGDALGTGVHAVNLSGYTDCVMRNFSVQTEDGGGKVCYCIFIEDGADRFHIETVWIIDSDDDGFRIEGTNITHGWILSSKILDTDDLGISVNMDTDNTMTYLQAKDNILLSAGDAAMSFYRIDYAEIFDNVIVDPHGEGILIVIGNDNYVTGNTIVNAGTFGISLQVNAVRTIIGYNLTINPGTACINDAGTDSRLPTLPPKDFIYWGGGSAGYTVGNPSGIDIDANAELAVCHFPLPLEVQQVVRVKIWAYSNVAEANNNMLLDIRVTGGGSGESWNTEDATVANHPSEETGGIAINDVIHWIIDATDDTDIGDLRGGDYLEIKAVGEAAVAPDIATDALFGGVEIEYV